MHALLRHLAGKVAHIFGVDAGQIAVADALEVAAIGHRRELDLAVLDGFEVLHCVAEGRCFAGGTAVDADDLGAEVGGGFGVELGVLIPLAAALVQGHVDDGGWGVG